MSQREGLQRPDLATATASTSQPTLEDLTHLACVTRSKSPILVDPQDANRSSCGAGHRMVEQRRGVFRSANGGQSFERSCTRMKMSAPPISSLIEQHANDLCRALGRARRAVGNPQR